MTDPNTKTPKNNATKWTTFTYVGRETLHITNIFRKTDLKIAFRTTNTLGNLISRKNHTTDKFSKSRVYRLICSGCHKTYVGQTGRQFSARYREHLTTFHKKNNSLNYAKHLNEADHSFGPIHDIMEILHYQGKEGHLNTVEKFHIYAEFAANNQLSDPQTHSPNTIFDILTKAHRPQ
jgi:hypothetical protein